MSRERFDEDCPLCRPAAINLRSGEIVPDDHPMMQAIDRAWAKAGPLHRQAFHRVTCLNSRSTLDLALVRELQQAMQREAAP